MRRRAKLVVWILILAAGTAFFMSPTFSKKLNRWGKSQYYTRIVAVGIPEDVLTDDEELLRLYRYHQPGFGQNGSERMLMFTASKLLRTDALLRVYTKQDGTVTAWEEVIADDVPPPAWRRLVP